MRRVRCIPAREKPAFRHLGKKFLDAGEAGCGREIIPVRIRT